jgi:hypothetical protein
MVGSKKNVAGIINPQSPSPIVWCDPSFEGASGGSGANAGVLASGPGQGRGNGGLTGLGWETVSRHRAMSSSADILALVTRGDEPLSDNV